MGGMRADEGPLAHPSLSWSDFISSPPTHPPTPTPQTLSSFCQVVLMLQVASASTGPP